MTRGQGFGEAPGEQLVQSWVVFDPTDGTVLHIHESVTLEGSEAVSDYEVEQRALSLAADIRQLESSTLKAIHVVDTEELLIPGRHYAVDLDKLALVQRRDP